MKYCKNKIGQKQGNTKGKGENPCKFQMKKIHVIWQKCTHIEKKLNICLTHSRTKSQCGALYSVHSALYTAFNSDDSQVNLKPDL